jgi:hypothetical protein
MFGIDAVEVAAVSNAGKNGLSFVDWRSKGFNVEVPLPR